MVIRALMIITLLKLYTDTTAGHRGQSKCFFLCITCFYVFIYSTDSLIISSSSAIHRRNFFGWRSPPLSLRNNRYYIICLAAMPHTPQDTSEQVPLGLVFHLCSVWFSKEMRMLCKAPRCGWSCSLGSTAAPASTSLSGRRSLPSRNPYAAICSCNLP